VKLKADLTRGEKYEPAMRITDQAEADQYFEALVAHCLDTYPEFEDPHFLPSDRRAAAELIERTNLGYWAGYHSLDTRARVEKFFRGAHPIFGPVSRNGPPSAKQAFILGQLRGAGVELATLDNLLCSPLSDATSNREGEHDDL